MNRKLRKLLRDPKLFFVDMYKKRIRQVKRYLPIKRAGKNQYTVVAAVYNVEKYLDDFFSSLTKQRLNFKKHIQIILVDDGSVDKSAEIIQKWQQKFPQNIRYFYKENGGQASARNLGLQYVETDWVTFIDPDDFVSPDYFYKTDTFLSKNANISIVGCPLVFYFEDKDMVKDTHPLKYRFAKGDVVLPLSNLKDHLQLSASTAFFKIDNIRNAHISFDEAMKPSFEDAKFVTDYILNTDLSTNAAFLSKISYFYRKRSDGSSTLDGAWQNPLLFSRVIEKGCIEILKTAKKKFGNIPEHIQRIVLYHIIWYFGRIVNKPAALPHLNEEQKKHFVALLHEMFSYIDEKTILRFNLAGTWFFQKVALLGLFKNTAPKSQIAYIEDFDLKKKQILVKYFSNFPIVEQWVINGKEIFPKYQKEVVYDFLGSLYTKEYRTWLPCHDMGDLELFLAGKRAKLTFSGKQFDKLPIETVFTSFKQKSTVKSNAWILMDRDNQADDNAEHLYRYISENHPEQDIYFALKKNSSDWKRLEQDGFNLLEFGSSAFESKLKDCEKIISSHVDGYITHYFKDNSLLDKDYVFLQHGITKDDLSGWLNTKKIACFVTATNPEYHSIVGNTTAYKFGKKEVKLTGFPRYDRLLINNNTESKQILIMPTWRSSIVGTYISGTERTRNPDFMKTNYARHWHGFMNHTILKELNDQGYQIVFAPHPSIQEYMDEFTVPDFIKIYSYSEGNIQSVFQNTSILITDYSSVAFDVAYLNKAILYYQFDYDEVFSSGNHTYQKGYFDYNRDGFGAVAYNETELLAALKDLVDNQAKVPDLYQTRINKTFQFRDSNNCERVYQAILDLDKPELSNDLNYIEKMILQVENLGEWGVAASRIAAILENSSDLTSEERANYINRYLNALFKGNKFIELLNWLEKHPTSDADYWRAKVSLQIGKPTLGIKYFSKNNIGTLEDKLIAILAASLENNVKSVKKLNQHISSDLSEKHHLIQLLAEKILQKEYFVALALIETLLTKFFTVEDKKTFKLELLASYLCMRLNNFQQAHKYLVRYEGHQRGDIACRIAIARLAKLRQNGEKLFTQINRAFGQDLLMMPQDLVPAYLQELHNQGNTTTEKKLLEQFTEKYPDSKTIASYKAAVKEEK
ncbi:CDP-glycerol glycerophosphotransferase family protein [Neisseria subflava]|uniref:CDP-glycerol glycerophosphotransferase family protein n=1 Tax=Neisseria subflava TaxID=28449 RepID=UPI0020B83176|nr:CDP-glycerol glycerophosphotransferase family protein [Neisseria subflava]